MQPSDMQVVMVLLVLYMLCLLRYTVSKKKLSQNVCHIVYKTWMILITFTLVS